MTRRRTLVLFVFIAALATACGGESGQSTIPPEVPEILATSSEVMGEIDTVHFTIERSGAAVHIDPDRLLEFREATGRFASPSRADATVTLGVGGLGVRVGAVAIDGDTWLTNPVTGEWEPAPAGYNFDPATLFDPDTGWRPLLGGGFTDVTLIGEEEIDGTATYHVRGTALGDRVETITAGLVRVDAVEADVWIDRATGEVIQVTFGVDVTGGTAEWLLQFSDYGAEVQVDPPDLES